MSLLDPLKINCHGQQSFFSTLLNLTPLWSWRQNQMHADAPTGNSPKWIKPTGATIQSFPPFFLCCSFPALELCLDLSEWNYVWCCTDVFASLVFPGCLDKLALIMYIRTSAKTCSKNGMDFFFTWFLAFVWPSLPPCSGAELHSLEARITVCWQLRSATCTCGKSKKYIL